MNNHGTYTVQDKKHTFSFASISDYAAHVAELEKAGKHWPTSARSSQKERGEDWASCSFDKALERAHCGGYWPEGAEQLQSIDLSGEAGEIISQLTEEIELAPIGGAVDVGEYLADGEDCFYSVDEIEQSQTIVKIAVMNICSCDTSAAQVMNRGRAVMALIDALESRNLSVQLDVVDSFKEGKKARGKAECHFPEYRTTIKQAGEPWSAGTVAYALANSSWARRLGFRAAEGSPCGSMTGRSYGGGAALNSWERDTVKAGDYDFVYGYLTAEDIYSTASGALKAVITKANRQSPEILAA